MSESGSEISSDGFDDIFEWKDNLSSVSVEDFTADFGPRHGLGLDASPKDFFDLFFGDQSFDHIVCAFKSQRSKFYNRPRRNVCIFLSKYFHGN